MKQPIKNVCRVFVLVVFFVAAQTVSVDSSFGGQKKDRLINCDIQNQACTRQFLGRKITLDITPRPVKAMQELTFHVKLTGRSPHGIPYIDLSMPGMKMGPNRVILKAGGPNSFVGRGVIVRCPSGRTIWKAAVTFPEKGVVDFIFDVIY